MDTTTEPITEKCGHHCGTMLVGSQQYTGHCPCSECHNLAQE